MKKVLTFYVGGEHFGIDVNLVKEITRNIEYTPLLKGKEHIKGLMNLRGNIVTIFDLEIILGENIDKEVTNLQCIVLKTEDDQQLGFLVNKTGDVIEITKEDFWQMPEDIVEEKRNYISSVIKLQGDMLKILDFHKIFEVENF
ncbi:chemotaxis protein CheW [Clostridium sp. CS001]|uniref:chemotaxis protein CheW n=1 Tax=Clostridium sp. CS001 TaxID=2880648 RepID=UPI001CF53999|nr:chemotaxis protein CheW [Clostridium sp. CS001]MCB2291641.1 chemotaxis protein CheW [Clostridium sp. CS001]